MRRAVSAVLQDEAHRLRNENGMSLLLQRVRPGPPAATRVCRVLHATRAATDNERATDQWDGERLRGATRW